MNYTIEKDHDKKIIRYTHIGCLDRESIGAAWKVLLQTPEFTVGNYHLLTDYRNSEFCNAHNDVEEIIDFLYKIRHILKDKKQAMIVDNPMSTALSILFEERVTSKVGFIVKVFSTKEEALRWLSI